MAQMGRRCLEIKGRIGRALALCAALLVTSACTPLYDDYGYAPTDAELSEITVGVDTRETVAEAVGSPSSSGVLRDSGYYYVSQRTETFLYKEPQIIDREVVAVSFDGNGVVTNIERFGLRDGQVVALSRRVTNSNVQGLGFLRQLIGNVGALDLGSGQ
jgi:outer membrane protein assembly factor BamE (lipoprotein component of BamABCDE complex)